MPNQELIDRYARRLRAMNLCGVTIDDWAVGAIGSAVDTGYPGFGGSAERLDRVAAVLAAHELVCAERTFAEAMKS